MNKNTLYITFDGLSDPLGQSQILPYLIGLAENGFNLTILSCEKKNRLEAEKNNIAKKIQELNIDWQYILYDDAGGFFSRLFYVQKIKKLALKNQKTKQFRLVHCRSYLAALIGLQLKLKQNIPFLFDMRGFWADERLDGGIWKKSNPIQLSLYFYFKWKEKQFLKNSDAIVSLTQSGKSELEKKHGKQLITPKTNIIPCCTNIELFNKTTTTSANLPGISMDDFILIYTGSIGTWYYTREIIDCALVWKKHIPKLKLLILSNDQFSLEKIVQNYSPEEQEIILRASCSFQQVPSYLALARAAIFFIKPAYSKIASSPTKMAECWAMNLPIITNTGIGDNDIYFHQQQGGVLLSGFSQEYYEQAYQEFKRLPQEANRYRKLALQYFDNKQAIEKYTRIYQHLNSAPHK